MTATDISTNASIPSMSEFILKEVKRIEEIYAQLPQEVFEITQSIHAGMYARTLKMPPDRLIVGAHIKIPTFLIVAGDALVGDGITGKRYTGHHVLTCEAHRKQIIVSKTQTFITMLFPTAAKTVKDAEQEFTDEWPLLQTRNNEA